MNQDALRRRADLVDRVRRFFRDLGFVEVTTPLLSDEVIPEEHIEPPRVADEGWLQASPEMHHKLLLAAGSGPIFELTRSFRAGESGTHHRSEFTLLEWYRPGDDLNAAMDLTEKLLQDTVAAPPSVRTSYVAAFVRTVGANPWSATLEELLRIAEDRGRLAQDDFESMDRDEVLNFLLADRVESTLGETAPELLFHYPATQAALAATRVDDDGRKVAERFEVYWRGVELANGYHELTDAAELRRRLETVNHRRAQRGASVLPLPERLLAAMESPGLPPCAGVALGIDRLLMLSMGAEHIDDVNAI